MEKKLTDFEKIVLDISREAVGKAISERMSAYDSPLKKIVDDSIKVNDEVLRKLVNESLGLTLAKEDFKIAIKEAFDHKLARVMVEHLSRSIDKAINAIRSDPTIKARMVLAIEKIISEVK